MTGPEGAGKSTLLSKMGGQWFNDSIVSTEGKEGMQQLRGTWLIEWGELSSIKRSDVESVKAYLSKQVDIYRAAYDRRTNEHPRQCVFCGTTNELFFLKGDNGNRRFWVVPVDPSLRKYKQWAQKLDEDRNQLWAEAVHYFKQGERLYLDAELEAQAKQRQADYNDDSDDPLATMLRDFLDAKLPVDWNTYDLARRRAWWRNPDPLDAAGTELRTRISAAEFICERMGRDMADKEYKYLARKVSKMIAKTSGWEKLSATKHCQNLYGIQRGYRRTDEANTEEDL
jgi:predicted P-loop ATPase